MLVVVLLTVDGFQIPTIPLMDVLGKIGALAPLHIGAIAVKIGNIIGLTVMLKVAELAHCPAFGVKV